MVSYQAFVSVVNEVATERYDGNRDAQYQQDLMSVVGEAWTQNKNQLTGYNRSQTRTWVENNIDFQK